MGWGDCGTDSDGRPIGYLHEATCDHPGCAAQIHRGLAYVCGDMHGESDRSCGRYFCDNHRRHYIQVAECEGITVCDECALLTPTDDDGAPLDYEGFCLA